MVALLALAVPAASAQARTAAELLADRPFAPTNRAMFDTFFYPDTPAMAPAAGSEPTLQQVSAMLDVYLAAEFPGDTSAQNAARAVFTNPTATSKIPSPSLRAAFATLRGTIADAAIDFVLTAQTPGSLPKVIDAQFAPPSQFSDSLFDAEVKIVNTTGQMNIIFNDRFKAENPFLFTNVWAHEPLHQDNQTGNKEEAIVQSLATLVYLRQLARHPALASEGTELARSGNTKALLRLNSGLGSRLGLYASNGNRDVLPGSAQPDKRWADAFLTTDETATPGNALLGPYLGNTHDPAAPTCSSTTFNKYVLDCIDQNGNGALTPDELVAAARALRLDLDTDGDQIFDSRDGCPTLAAATASGCPASSPGPVPSPEPGLAQITAGVSGDLKAAAATALKRLTIRKLLKRRGFTLQDLQALTAGRLTLELSGSATAGNRSGAATKVRIAIGSRSVSAAGRYSLKGRLTKNGKRLLRRALLRRARRIKGTLTLRFAPSSGQAVKRSAAVRIRR